MAYENKPVIQDFDPGELSFEGVLDSAFERLREKHIQYSIKRINEMDEELKILEKELDEFIGPSHD